MTLPNFLIIGAAKSGTTALYNYLRQHPEVYMSPVKEPRFFALEGEEVGFRGPGDMKAHESTITDIRSYSALFDGVTNEKAIGEASVLYLYSPKAPVRIRHYIPDVKLIAILRHPVYGAYSSFLHVVRDGREPLTDFAEALKKEDSRIRAGWGSGWHHKQRGFYYVQLKRYFDIFDRAQIKVYLYEDYLADPVSVIQDTLRFIDVDDSFVPNMAVRHNVSGIPRSRGLHEFLNKPNPIKSALRLVVPSKFRPLLRRKIERKNLEKPPLSPEVRKQLIEEYRHDIMKLQDLIGRDLSKWLE